MTDRMESAILALDTNIWPLGTVRWLNSTDVSTLDGVDVRNARPIPISRRSKVGVRTQRRGCTTSGRRHYSSARTHSTLLLVYPITKSLVNDLVEEDGRAVNPETNCTYR